MINETYEEFIEALNRYNVNYCIIGAEAVSHYVRSRYSKDIDILVLTDTVNAEKIYNAVKDFFDSELGGLTVEDFKTANQIIQFGYEPNRIDIITGIEELSQEKNRSILKNKIKGTFGKSPAFFASIDDLIILKKAAVKSEEKRAVDVEDLELLEKKKAALEQK